MQKIFKHNPLPKLDIKKYEKDGKRFYITNIGDLESVTTRLSVLSKKGIDQWRKKIGEEAADKITAQAGVRGTTIHEMAEKYLKNQDYKKGIMPINLYTFASFKKILDNSVGIIYAQEYALYSKKLKTAGTVDLVCDFDNTRAVVDFKSSLRIKEEKYIQNYFWQATAYSIMMEELYDFIIEQIIVIVAPDDETNVQIFRKSPEAYKQDVLDFFR